MSHLIFRPSKKGSFGIHLSLFSIDHPIDKNFSHEVVFFSVIIQQPIMCETLSSILSLLCFLNYTVPSFSLHYSNLSFKRNLAFL